VALKEGRPRSRASASTRLRQRIESTDQGRNRKINFLRTDSKKLRGWLQIWRAANVVDSIGAKHIAAA
jgi:hypothetical protein